MFHHVKTMKILMQMVGWMLATKYYGLLKKRRKRNEQFFRLLFWGYISYVWIGYANYFYWLGLWLY